MDFEIKREGKNKFLFLSLILLIAIIFSYNFIISQTESLPGDQDSLIEGQTPTDSKNPEEPKKDISNLIDAKPDSVKVSDSFSNFSVYLPKGSSTYNLKDNNIEINSQKGESVELNGNEFSIKPSDGELGKGKVVIGKKDEEEFPETMEGTSYTVLGEKDSEGNTINAKDELAGREIELTPGSKVEQIKKGNIEQVDINVPKGGEIHTPGKRKNGKEEEEKEKIYRWFGNDLSWLGSDGQKYLVNGELQWTEKLGFHTNYYSKTSVNGINIKSNDLDPFVQIYNDGLSHKKALGSYVSFGKNNLVTGSNNLNPGPKLSFPEGVYYGVHVKQGDHFEMLPFGNSEVSIKDRTSEGLISQAGITGYGGTIFNGYKSYSKDNYRFEALAFEREGFYGSSPVELILKDSSQSVLGEKWIINNDNRAAMIPNNYNFDGYGSFINDQGKFDSRVEYNDFSSFYLDSLDINQNLQSDAESFLLDSNNKRWFDSLNEDQQNNFLRLDKNEINKLTNLYNSPEMQVTILSSEDVHNALKNPSTMSFQEFRVGNSRRQVTRNFDVYNPDGNAIQYAAIIENNRRKHTIELTGEDKDLTTIEKPFDVNIAEIKNYKDYAEGGLSGRAAGITKTFFDEETIIYSAGINKLSISATGTPENLIYNTLPHETAHAVIASQIKKDIPDWIDEGYAVTAESYSSRSSRDQLLSFSLNGNKNYNFIPFSQMMSREGLPTDYSDVLQFYSQAHSSVQYLISKGGGGIVGKREFYKFMKDGSENNDWQGALKSHYGFENSAQFENAWRKDFESNLYNSRGEF